jgi:hypothetical protein
MRDLPTRRRRLAADLRATIPDASLALALTTAVYLVIAAPVRSGTAPAVIEMPFMKQTGGIWARSLSQARGFAALLWSG